MTIRVNSLTFSGINIINIDVQVYMAPGIPSFTIVGLPDKAIAESKERVRAAIHSLGVSLPAKRITINLSPADIFKEGSHFDLAITLAILAEMKIIHENQLEDYLIMGELALDGSLVSSSGILPAAVGANASNMGIICPAKNGAEAAWSGNPKIIAAENLLTIINHFKNIQIITPPKIEQKEAIGENLEMADVKGQHLAKRAIEIAASGNHNLLMSGPPGAGKSMLAKRLLGISPSLSAEEMLECSMIKSIAGGLEGGKIETQRPFRAPHHSCSMPAMVGGGMGKRVMPGEISLAHNGILFLDELPEFPRSVLDSLRQPIESGNVLISRANSHITYPSKFQLIAAMNPCRCGYLSDKELSCNKAPRCATDYQTKISGPLLDRIDLHIDIQPVNIKDIENSQNDSENTETIKARIQKVRDIQRDRYKQYGISTNAELDGKLLLEIAKISQSAKDLLHEAVDKMKLTMRGYNRIIRVAKTIADMEETAVIEKIHIAEAINYRPVYIKK